MATLSTFEEVFISVAQDYLPKFVTGVSTLAKMNFDATIKSTGQTVRFPRMNYASISVDDVLTRDSSFTAQYANSTSEILTVNKEKFINYNLPKGDLIQASYFTMADISTRLTRRMAETVDTSVLGQIATMAYTFDDGDLSGTAGDPIDVTTANAGIIPAELKAVLTDNNVQLRDTVFVTDAKTMAKFDQILTNRDASQSVIYSVDGAPVQATVKSLDNGYAGMVQGVRAFVSNNLPSVSEFSYTGQPTAGETIVYRGVTITFVAALTTASNEVLIGATADDTYANLAAFFNDQAGVNVPVTTAVHTGLNDVTSPMVGTGNTDPVSDFQIIKRLEMTVTVDATANTVTLATNGGGKARIGATLPANLTLVSNYILGYFGTANTIKLAMQTPTTGTVSVIRDLPNSPMSQIQVHTLYGVLATYESRIQGAKILIKA